MLRLHERLEIVDRAAARIAGISRWIVVPAIYGVALGAGLWALVHGSRVSALARNAVDQDEIRAAATWAAIGAAILVAAYAIAIRRATGDAEERARAVAARWNPRLAPCLAAPLIALLRLPGIEAKEPSATLLFIALATAAIGLGIRSLEPATDAGAAPASRSFAAPIVLGAAWVAYGLWFSRLSIINHHALNTRAADLGYYDNIFWQSLHGHPLACSYFKVGHHAAAHFDPILVLLSPLYALYPRAEMLLVLQSFWLGAGLVPLYLLARERGLQRVAAGALALAYVLYPALHGANLYEFHSLSLLPTIALWMLYAAETGRRRAYWALLALALLCREDIALVLCPLGLYFLLDGRPGRARLGWGTIAASIAYFVIVKRFFMTSSAVLNSGADARSFEYYYAVLIPFKDGVKGLVSSVLGNPAVILAHVTTAPKLTYLALLFLPLVFLPLLARAERLLLVYGLLFCLLGSHEPLFSIHFQYSSLITPFAFAGAVAALAAIGAAKGSARARALAVTALAASLLVSYKFGGITENASFRGGYRPNARSLDPAAAETYAWVEATAASIPRDASVAVTPLPGPHVSGRRAVYFYNERDDVEFIFADEREVVGDLLARHRTLTNGTFVEVARHGPLALYKRR